MFWGITLWLAVHVESVGVGWGWLGSQVGYQGILDPGRVCEKRVRDKLARELPTGLKPIETDAWSSHPFTHSPIVAHSISCYPLSWFVLWKCHCALFGWGYISLGFNSLAPRRFQSNLRKIIFKLILMTDGCDISNKIALRWTSLDLSDDKSTLFQVMAWCCQASSHYLNQCWPRSLSPYGVTRPQWVKLIFHD